MSEPFFPVKLNKILADNFLVLFGGNFVVENLKLAKITHFGTLLSIYQKVVFLVPDYFAHFRE
jgi:hypothetical protein